MSRGRVLASMDRPGDSSGFTLAEVVVATTIFFFAFSAIMSLVVANNVVSAKSRQRAVIINAANSYVERVRAMPYDAITSSAVATSPVTTDGYTVSFTPTVTWRDDATIPGAQNYKVLTLTVNGVRGTATTMTWSTETIIKPTDTGINAQAKPATISFTAGSPEDGSVKWGTSVLVGAQAQAVGANVTLTSMKFYVDGVAMRDLGGARAEWSLSAASASQSFNWDTTALNEDGNPLSADGLHVIKIECWDSNQRQAFTQRQVIVDNSPPSAVSTITATSTTATRADLSWVQAIDGRDLADHYAIRQWRQTTGGENEWTGPLGYNFTGSTGTTATAPISRYYYDILTVGPAPNYRTAPSRAHVVLVTRPSLTGTYKNTNGANGDCTVNLAITQPTFPSSALTVTLRRSKNANMSNPDEVKTIVGSTYTETFEKANAYYFQVEMVITPTGYGGGTPVSVKSQIIGPNSTGNNAQGTLPTAGW